MHDTRNIEAVLKGIRLEIQDAIRAVRTKQLEPRLVYTSDDVACALLENELRRFVPRKFRVDDAFMAAMLASLEAPGAARREQLLDLTAMFVALAANDMEDIFVAQES